jgi:3-mercaptopyruvate sulfurtransferase SseA
MRPVLTFVAVGFVALIALAACNSTDKLKSNKSAAVTASPTAAPDGVRRITVPELQDLLARNEAVIVDVRSPESYKAAHIRGAKLIPVGEILNHVDELPKDKLIVTYCS